MPRPSHNLEIVHVIGAFVAGGAERFVVDLLLAMHRYGENVGLIVLSSRDDSAGIQMRDRLAEAGIPAWVGPSEKVGFRTTHWYRRVLRETAPRILHMHTSNTVLIHEITRPAHSVKPRLFRTIHNTELPTSWLKVRALARSGASTIACSAAAAAAYESQFGRQSIVIPNGVHFDWPIRNRKRSVAAKRRLGLGENAFHVVNVGRMVGTRASEMQKAQDTLIQAWRQADMGETNSTLHLLGDGEARPLLEKTAGGDSSIAFHGVVSNVREWLIAGDCFAMPSRWEGLPIAGIEAIGTGIPLLFSDIRPLQELNAPAVIWVPVDDVTALGAALRRMRTDPPIAGEAATSEWRTMHDIAATARDYIRAYRKKVEPDA